MVLHEGSSSFTGEYVIEECEEEGGGRVRRLVFLNSPALAQTVMNISVGMWYIIIMCVHVMCV